MRYGWGGKTQLKGKFNRLTWKPTICVLKVYIYKTQDVSEGLCQACVMEHRIHPEMCHHMAFYLFSQL